MAVAYSSKFERERTVEKMEWAAVVERAVGCEGASVSWRVRSFRGRLQVVSNEAGRKEETRKDWEKSSSEEPPKLGS